MKVIIIGAGIGGSCLAHGLVRSGIEVKVYERGARHLLGLPGYGIHINPFGQQAMRECLPGTNWSRFQSKAIAIGGHNRFFDERLRVLADVVGSHTMDGRLIQENRLSISRSELREILLDGLSDTETGRLVIQWEKTFERYENLPDGSVRAHFSDGSHDSADVLVGADASNSRVRKQYVPHVERISAGVSLIVGRTRLSNIDSASFPAVLLDGSPNTLIPEAPESIFVSVWRAPVDTNVEPSQANIDYYAVWAYIAAENGFPADIGKFSQQQLLALALKQSAGFDKRLQTLMKMCEVDSVSLVPLRTMPRLPFWTPSTVTLLGDSIHNMTPMAGIGANTALRDARLLRNALSQANTNGTSVVSAIGNYENQMRIYANDAVVLSLRNAQNAVSESKFKRGVFRTSLWAVERFPLLKRVMFPPGR